MLIDNLHRINSPSDLFKYICELEEGIEEDNEKLKQLAAKYLRTRELLKLFLCHEGWSPADCLPITGRDLEVFITATGTDEDVAGMFETAYYYPEEGFRLCEACKTWKVKYWRYLGEPDNG